MQSQNWQDSVFEHIIPIKIDVQIFLRTFCGTALARERERDNITTHIRFLCVESTKMVFAVVVPCACFVLLGTVSLALPVNLPALFVMRVSCTERAFYVSCSCACFSCLYFAFLLITTLASYEIRGMNLPNLPGVSR